MRLVVLDTNVIISGGLTPTGIPARIINDWVFKAHIQTVTSPAVIREYRFVTSRAKFLSYGFPPPWLEVLIRESLQLEDAHTWPHKLPDQDDLPFLSLAHRAGAWLITGNLKHYPASKCDGVTVVSPADYLAYLEGSMSPRR